jgi:hypothetical protein
MKSKLFLFTILSVFAFACKKDKIAPSLSITSPAENAQSSAIVIIKGTASDEHLNSMSFKVTRDGTGAVLYTKELSLDGLSSYNFEEQFDPGVVAVNTNVTLTIEVIDNNSSKTSKVVHFTLIP